MQNKTRELFLKIASSIMLFLLFFSILGVVSQIERAVAGSDPLPPYRVDNDHDGIDDNFEQLLAERFAPVIYLSPDERNYPVNVDWFLARARLEYYEDLFPDVEETVPGADPVGTQSNLIGPPWIHPDSWGPGHPGPHGGSPPEHGRISTIEPDPERFSDQTTFTLPDVADEYKVGSLNPGDWKTYVHVYPNTLGGVNIQYWNVFAYNGFDFLGFGNHGGDWDASVQVVLSSSLQPWGVWYSRHDHDHPGDYFAWNQVHVYESTHPLVMIDAGGHAAFKDMQDWDDYWTINIGSVAWRDNPDGPGFGTVWKTWTGGQVRQDPSYPPIIVNAFDLTVNPGVTGGLVNVGEYNPGIHQACQLLSGQFYPLNNQVFIRYSGRWGSIGLIFSGPRGPVFQGYDGGVYTSWYNQGANVPANPVDDPWCQDPTSTLSVGTPAYSTGGTTFVSSQTKLTLATSQNAIASGFGSARMFYRYFPSGTAPPGFSQYSIPFTLPGTDGTYSVDYYSLDAINNNEGVHTRTFVLDNTPPTTSLTIGNPQYTDSSGNLYVTSWTPFTLSASDLGSGVAKTSYRIRNSTYSSGWLTYTGFFTLTGLTTSLYSVDYYSTDNVGNAETAHTMNVILNSKATMIGIFKDKIQALINQVHGSAISPFFKNYLEFNVLNCALKQANAAFNFAVAGDAAKANSALGACKDTMIGFKSSVMNLKAFGLIPTAIANSWIATAQTIINDINTAITTPI